MTVILVLHIFGVDSENWLIWLKGLGYYDRLVGNRKVVWGGLAKDQSLPDQVINYNVIIMNLQDHYF